MTDLTRGSEYNYAIAEGKMWMRRVRYQYSYELTERLLREDNKRHGSPLTEAEIQRLLERMP